MKYYTKNLLNLACLVALTAGFSLSSHAALLVDFTPSRDYDDQSWHETDGPIDVPLSLETPFFSGPGVTPIYGGFKSGGDVPGELSGTVNNFRLLLSSGNDSTDADDFIFQYSMLLWKADDFLASGDITFDQSTNSSFNIPSGLSVSVGTLRESSFVIVDSGKYYVSNDQGIVTNGISDNGSELTWAEWQNPAGDIADQTGPGKLIDGLTYNGMTFTNIEAVGYYSALARNGTNNPILRVDGFQVTAIPEPATFGLFAAFGGALLVVLRRRRAC